MSEKPHIIELWDTARLVPYSKNAKKHAPEQVTKLAKAIKAFGWTQPIVIDGDGVIIAGHGRRLAALELGLKKVPVIVRRDLSKLEADALRLADNRVTSTAYDMDLMQESMRELIDGNFDIELAGFDLKEIDFVDNDLGEINSDFFTDDITSAVERQQAANKNAIAATDDIAAPVGDAFGFKRVSVAQSREIRGFMTRIETATGEVGAEALISFISNALEHQ